MAKVLSQLSSVLRVWPHKPRRRAVKDGGKIYSSMCNTVIWSLKNCFNPSQTLFWRKEHSFLDQTIVQKLFYIYFNDEKILYKWPALYCILTITVYRVCRRGNVLGKDDSCDRTLAIYYWIIYLHVHFYPIWMGRTVSISRS